jgi:chromosome segregation ATPase
MAPDNPVIPMRIMRELDRLRTAAGLGEVGQVHGQERLDPNVSGSIDRVLQASELIKALSSELDRARRQISELKLGNGRLVSQCTEAHTALKEFKDQLQIQVGRADAAEASVLRLERQLTAAENAKHETQFNLSRLTELIEESLPIFQSAPAVERTVDTASVA